MLVTERALDDLDTRSDPAIGDSAAEAAANAPATHAAPATGSTSAAPPADTRVIWLLLGATFVVFLNETIMGVAIPHLVVDLQVSLSAAQWLTTGFLLTMAVVIPITGFLIKRFPTRPVFIAAMSLFSAGTLLAAVAPGFELLLAGRIVQATGTAIMMPLLMTTIMTVVPPRDRGRFMGRVSIVMSVAPAIGPAISGLILSFLNWRFMFWLVLPIAVVMLLIGARRVTSVGDTERLPIDVFSIVLSAIGFGGLVYGLSLAGGEASGATPAGLLWATLAVGAAGIAAFVARQLVLQRRDAALLDLRTFKSGNFAVSVALMVVMMAALFGTIIVLPVYLQNVLKLEPLATGILLLPGGLAMGLLGPTVGRLFDRYGPRPLLVPGSIVVSGVLWALTTVGPETSEWFVLAMHVVLSIGLAFMFTPLFTSALGSVQPKFYSYGSAIVGTVQQVAGAAGTALFITVLTAQQLAAQSAGATAFAAEASGIRTAFLVGAIISIVAIVGAFFVRRPADMVEGADAHHGGH
ncbi:DHA2 family efflux MFS transporter permease subunit [Agromyces protaetiae]|uniref:DHA2 family efflux MFS transporter permease subunit n=1 Tax=Agromyces protaetiae TaxID=2509455 RepID=A0A4P6FGA1_9MICO|nr:DHA2 family efflux MFS transporter permease subunit [Agromyces protaetiae]